MPESAATSTVTRRRPANITYVGRIKNTCGARRCQFSKTAPSKNRLESTSAELSSSDHTEDYSCWLTELVMKEAHSDQMQSFFRDLKQRPTKKSDFRKKKKIIPALFRAFHLLCWMSYDSMLEQEVMSRIYEWKETCTLLVGRVNKMMQIAL